MKIALPSRNNQVDSHFGNCEYFTIYTAESGQITGQETVASPEGCGCKSNIVHTLAEKGVSIMLAGNMGDGAVGVLQRFGIGVIRGCSGDIREVAEAYLAGNISDSGDTCHEHECSH